MTNRTARSERPLFTTVADRNIEVTSVAEMIGDHLCQMSSGEDDLLNPEIFELTDEVLDERSPIDGCHRLGDVWEDPPEPCPEPPSKNQSFH